MEFLSDQGWIRILISVFCHFDLDAKHQKMNKGEEKNKNFEENIVSKDDDSLGFICIPAIIKMGTV